MKKLLASTLVVSSFAVAGWANAAVPPSSKLVVGSVANSVDYQSGGDDFFANGGNFAGSTLDGKALAMAYCINLFGDIALNETYDSIVSNTGLGLNSGAIAYLIDNVTTQSANDEIGLQAAIWELVHDVNFTFTGTGASLTAYNSYLSDALNHVNYVGSANVLWMQNSLSGNSAQDWVGKYAVSTAATPVPAAVWLFGSGIAGLVASRRRKSGIAA